MHTDKQHAKVITHDFQTFFANLAHATEIHVFNDYAYNTKTVPKL